MRTSPEPETGPPQKSNLDNRFAVIPTRRDSPELRNLVARCLEASIKPIIIHPNPEAEIWTPDMSEDILEAETPSPEFYIDGCINLVRPVQNFQFWANTGFRYAFDLGGFGAKTLMLNDDLVCNPGALDTLFSEWEEHDYDVVTLDGRDPSLATPIHGWFFGVKAGVIWMDPSYVFWWGDDDLWNTAVYEGLTVGTLTAKGKRLLTHDRKDKPGYPPEFAAYAAADEALFNSRWG